MRIFRYEHNRAACTHPEFTSTGNSLTGHGPVFPCATSALGDIPKFGIVGTRPYTIMVHERCAVTAAQFDAWTDRNWTPVKIRDWDIVVYEVDEAKEGIDWRIDNNQVVFNPEFARYVGTVSPTEMQELARVARSVTM